jgi:TetR/AcrR family transcriptional regulator, ethionamide resistance regulator
MGVAASSGGRREEVKARLRARTLELAAQRPFQELRIEEIASAAGLSRSAFYFYYRDKHDLLIDAASEASEALYEQADRWWHGEGRSEELVRSALSGVAGLWKENEQLFRIATEVSTYDESVREFWRALVGRFVAGTAEHIRREQGVGTIAPGLDPERTAEVLIWGAERCLYVLVSTGDRDPEVVVDALADLWLRVLYGEPA